MIFLLRMRRNPINSTFGFKMDLKIGFLVPKTYMHVKLGLKTAFQWHFPPFFLILLLRMRRSTISSTSGFKMDQKIGYLVPKNIYTGEIRPYNCTLRAFPAVFRDFVTAHAQKHHLFYFRFQNGPQIRIPRAEKHIDAGN